MKHLIHLLLLSMFFVLPVSESFAQKTKDEIVMPEYPGGEAELHKYIISELQYPYDALVNKETGEVIIAFTVGMDGHISGVRVVRSVSESLDAEAVRVVGKMRSWRPGKKNGRPVMAEMTIPINFKVIYEHKYVNDSNDTRDVHKNRFKY